jgi:hypothetical protein
VFTSCDCDITSGGKVAVSSTSRLKPADSYCIIITSTICHIYTFFLLRWAGHVARIGGERGVHRVLVGKPEGKRPLGRPRFRWEDNIKMDVQEVGGGRGDWME